MEGQAPTLLVIALGAFLVPLLSGRIGIPAAVGEITFGILVGPVLNLVEFDPGELNFFEFLAEFGFVLLMFLAGLELDFANLERRGHRVLVLSGVIASLIMAFSFLGAYLMSWPPFFGIVLGAMSIGIVLVSLRETGQAKSDFGQTVILAGSLGEFLTIIIVTLYGIVAEDGGIGQNFFFQIWNLILIFAIAYAVLKTLRLLVWWFPARFARMIAVEDPSEVGVRAGFALMIALVAVAELFGMEAILGAFLAGALFSFVFREKGILETKLASVGHGFFIPIFFIHVGVEFELAALQTIEIYPLLARLLLVSLGIKVFASLAFRAVRFSIRDIAGASLLLATPLTLLVAIASIGLEIGALSTLEGATVILAAVVSGLLFPTAYKFLARRTERSPARAEVVAGDA